MHIFLGGETAFDACEPIFIVRNKAEKKLKPFFNRIEESDEYGTAIKDIGIITMILPDDMPWKERVLIRPKRKEADIRLKIDYKKFVHSNRKKQYLLYCKNVIDSILIIGEKQ